MPVPAPTWSATPPAQEPSPRPAPTQEPVQPPNAPGGGLEIHWTSIRRLAKLFDKTGDDVVALHRGSTSLATTSDLVGGDEDGRAFAEWYSDGYDSLTEAMRGIADKNFSSAGNFRDFEKFWDFLEQQIISTLPKIPDLPAPPIPQAPPRKEGA